MFELLMLTIAWQPLQGLRDLDYRLALVSAIHATDADTQEAGILARLAWTESRYVARVGRCAPGTTSGGRGAWQVMPRKPEGYKRACGHLDAQAELALERVRESREACAHLPENESLAVYAAGSCKSKRGRMLSKERWFSL